MAHQSLDDINTGRWDRIAVQIRQEHAGKIHVATNDLHRLKDITESTADDIWITFHGAKLWWTRLAPGPVEGDEISKFRRTLDRWQDRSESGFGRPGLPSCWLGSRE